MKNFYLFPLIVGLFFNVGLRAQWTNYGNAGFSPGGLSNWQNIEIDDNNDVYVSFNDEGLPTGQGTVMKYDGSAWTTIGSAGFTPGIAHHSSFCLGGGDTVYFSFADGNDTSAAAVMMYNGSSWSSIGSDLSLGECQYSDIEVASDGTPYVAFIDNFNGPTQGVVTVLTYNGTNWVPVGPNAVISATGSSYTSLAINSNDELYVAYQDGGAMDSVTVKKFDGSNWVTVGSTFLSQPFAGSNYIHIAIDHNDVPYVAYMNPYPSGPKASVHKFNGTSWVLVGPASFTSGLAIFTNLAFDKNNTPYLVYHDITLGMKASVMYFDGSNWAYLGSAGFTPAAAAHTAIALDTNDNPYVVYYDDANSGKTSVMIYCEAPSITALSSDTAICSGDSVTFSLTGDLGDAEEWYWYSGSCGGVLIDSGTAITVAPGSTTTYFARGEGNCMAPGTCSTVTVTVAPTPATPTISVSGLDLISSSATGNQWYMDGNPISGADGQVHTATQTGWYQVEITQGFCSAISDSVWVDTCDMPTMPLVITTINDFCPGETATLSHNGILNDATEWYWYSGSCGGSLAGTGATLTINPSVSTTYYVRGEGNCVTNGPCGSLLLSVLPVPPAPVITVNGFTLTSSETSGNQWYLEGAIIPGATGQVHVATATGTYTVEAGDPCKAMSDEVYLDPVGIGQHADKPGIEIHPVPFGNELWITSNHKHAVGSVTIFDAIGRVVYKNKSRAFTDPVNTSQLMPGPYFVKIITIDGSVHYQKALKN